MMIFQTMKFQSDATNRNILIYSRDRSIFVHTNEAAFMEPIRKHMNLHGALQKVYCKARIDKQGRLELGKVVPDPGW